MAFQPVGAMGRWNCQGVPLVYTADNPAAATLELVAAWKMLTDLPGYYLHSCGFEASDVEEVPVDLDVIDLTTTRAFGSTWAYARQAVVLKVPSAVIPGASNYLVNPRHPHSADRVWLAPRGLLRLKIDPLTYGGVATPSKANTPIGEHRDSPV